MTSLGPIGSGLAAVRILDYVILLCEDIAAMRAFYTETMGFEVYEEVPGRWVALRVGSSLLALRRRGRPYDGPAVDGASVQLAFRVPPQEVEAVAAQLSQGGVELLEELTDQSFGHRTVFFADPERNVIEIYAEI